MIDIEFKVIRPEELYAEHYKLWRETKSHYKSYDMPDFLFKRILKADFLIFRNFEIQALCLKRKKQVLICAHVFFHKFNNQIKPAIGLVVCQPDLSMEEAEFFWQSLRKIFPSQNFTGPMNGHAYLGFTIPSNNVNAKKIGFATAGSHSGLQTLWQSRELKPYRKYLSFETDLRGEFLEKIAKEIADLPEGFSVRPFRWWRAQEDINTLNELVNQAFQDHFNFTPLNDQENWDILKMSRWALTKGFCTFLLKDNRPVGFCMAMLDFNQVWQQGNSDFINLLTLIFKNKKISRARLMHIGLLPEFRGKGLGKFLRHQVILNLVKSGVQSLESSYIDEGNINSQKNVESTGGKRLHEFYLYQTI